MVKVPADQGFVKKPPLRYSGGMTCPLCGSRSAPGFTPLPWASVRDFPYHRCPCCSYVWLDRARAPSAREEEARYRQHRNDPAERGYSTYLESFIERAVLPFAGLGARLLDFGSGPVPALADLLAERGFRVSVYDPIFAPDRAALAGPFDLVAVHEVAEHLHRPYLEFHRLLRGLAPGGCLAVRTRFAPQEPGEFEGWWYREDPTHVGFFGSRSLAALADRLGMVVALDDGIELAVLRSRPGA